MPVLTAAVLCDGAVAAHANLARCGDLASHVPLDVAIVVRHGETAAPARCVCEEVSIAEHLVVILHSTLAHDLLVDGAVTVFHAARELAAALVGNMM